MGKLETWTSGVLLCTVSVGHPPHLRKSHKEGKCLHSNRLEPCRRQDFEILIHTEDTVDCYCWLLEKSVKHHTSPLVILLCSVACRAPGGHWAAVSSFIIQWKINQNSQIAACYHYLKLITKETFLCLQLGQTQALSSSNGLPILTYISEPSPSAEIHPSWPMTVKCIHLMHSVLDFNILN